MFLRMRRYENEGDYWRIRDFLRDVMKLNGLRELSWHVARLDYWRWHVMENCLGCTSIDNYVYLWEDESGELAAVINSEGFGEVHFQVHPKFDSV